MRRPILSHVICSAVFSAVAFLSFSAFAGMTADITVAYDPGTALANFPILVRISPTTIDGFDYTDMATIDGTDLAFEDANGTPLNYDIDTWNTSGESLVWVQVPSLAQGVKITMSYGGVANAVNDPTKVWTDADYVGVWHMNGMTAGSTVVDATGHGLDAVPTGATSYSFGTTDADALIGTSRANNATTAENKTYLLVANSDFLDVGADFTWTGWYDLVARNSYPRFVSRKNSWSDSNGWEIGIEGNNTKIRTRGSAGNPYVEATVSDMVSRGWMHLAGVFDGASYTSYADGTVALAGSVGSVVDNDIPLAIGNNPGGGEGGNYGFQGFLDECRLRDAVSTPEWIAAEYATVHDAAFLTYGMATSDTTPSVTVGFAGYTAATADFSVRLTSVGAGSSADIYFAAAPASGGTPTPVLRSAGHSLGDTFTVTASGLTPEVEYIAAWYCRNNLGVQSAVKTMAFTTHSGVRVSFTPSGWSAYASGTVSLQNFPVLVRLSPESISGFQYSDLQGDGSDMVFTDENGNNLSYEIETWNPGGETLVWVKVPEFTSATVINLQYGSSPNTGNVPTDVWSDYVGVWHMDGLGPTTTEPDSTANHYDGTLNCEGHVVSTGLVNGVVGNYRLMRTANTNSGIHDGGMVAYGSSNAVIRGNVSITGFVRISNPFYNPIYWRGITNDGYKQTFVDEGGWAVGTEYTEKVRAMAPVNKAVAIPSASQRQWTKFDAVYEGTTASLYFNGNLLSTWDVAEITNNCYPISFGTTARSQSGQLFYASYVFQDSMDELRVRNSALSAEWLVAEYETAAKTNFLSASAAQGAPDTPVVGFAVGLATEDGTALDYTVDSCGGAFTSVDIIAEISTTDDFAVCLTNVVASLQSSVVPTSTTYQVTGLASDTDYWVRLVASNEGNFVSTTVGQHFRTKAAGPSDAELISASGSQRSVTVTVNVTSLGAGSTYLLYYAGSDHVSTNAQEVATLRETRAVSAVGNQTFNHTGTFGDYISQYVVVSNGSGSQTYVSTIHVPTYTAIDGSDYTWTGPSGGAWNNAANWTTTASGDINGFPVAGSKAIFNAGEWTVALTRNEACKTLELKRADTSLTIASTSTNNLLSFAVSKSGNNIDLTVDNAAVRIENKWDTGVDGNVTLTNSASLAAYQLAVLGNGSRVIVGAGCALNQFGNVGADYQGPLQVAKNGTLEIEDGAILSVTGTGGYGVQLDHLDWIANTTNSIVFRGKAPSFATGLNILATTWYNIPDYKNYEGAVKGYLTIPESPVPQLVFYVPENGYDEAPLRCAASNREFASTYPNNRDLIHIEVPAKSPAVKSQSSVDTLLVDWSLGKSINTNNVAFGEVPDAEAGDYLYYTFDGNYDQYGKLKAEGTKVTGIAVHIRSKATTMIFLR